MSHGRSQLDGIGGSKSVCHPEGDGKLRGRLIDGAKLESAQKCSESVDLVVGTVPGGPCWHLGNQQERSDTDEPGAGGTRSLPEECKYPPPEDMASSRRVDEHVGVEGNHRFAADQHAARFERWNSPTLESTRQLSDALNASGHSTSSRTVAHVMTDELGYSLQANRKSLEGDQHPDRDAEFHYLNEQFRRHGRRGEPVVPVDTKNKIEHRLWSQVTSNWRGQPLISRAAIVNLIGATTTRTGLSMHAELDDRTYPRGIKISDEEMAAIRPRLEPHDFHGDWNYALRPPPRAKTIPVSLRRSYVYAGPNCRRAGRRAGRATVNAIGPAGALVGAAAGPSSTALEGW